MEDCNSEPSHVADGAAEVDVSDMMSTLVSLHTCADFFQLTEFNKALHKTTPGGKLARIFTKAERRNATSVSLDQMLRHQFEPLPAPLLRSCSGTYQAKALKAFSLVLRFSEDQCLTMDQALEAAQKLLLMAMRHSEVKDELYMQLLKQLRGNPDAASRLQLWQLFHLLAATTPPSKTFGTLLSDFVREAADNDEENGEVKFRAVLVSKILKRSLRSGGRKWVPSIEEIRAALVQERLKSVVYFLDDTCEEVTFDIATTVLEAVEQIAEIIDLAHYHSFSLFESRSSEEQGDEFILLDDQSYMADVLNELKQNAHRIGRLVFKKRMFRASDENIVEPQFLTLCYIQVQHDYLLSHYPVVYNDAAQLCALQLFAEFGSQLPGEDRMLRKAIDRYTLRDVKRMGTREEWNADVLFRFNTMKFASAEKARYSFLSILRSLPYGQSSFFPVGRMDDPIGLLPPKIVLGVNNRGVHFFRPVPSEYLHTVELRDIMQFGSSKSAVFFKMRVCSLMHTFKFETRHGEDICMALQTHINDIMVQRYAALPDSPSRQQEQWLSVQEERRMEESHQEMQKEDMLFVQTREQLLREHERNIRERDQLIGQLGEAHEKTVQLQKEKREITECMDVIEQDIHQLQSQLAEQSRLVEESHDADIDATAHVGVEETLVKCLDDAPVEELERMLEVEEEWREKVANRQRALRSAREYFFQRQEERCLEIQEWKDALFDVESDGRSRVNLQEGRIVALEKEVARAKMRYQETQSQLEATAVLCTELSELKTLAADVQQRDAVQAEIIERQKEQLQSLEQLYKREQLLRKKLYNSIEDQKGSIRVYARVRSILPREIEQGQQFVLRFPDDISLAHQWKREDGAREYFFDGVFHPSATQEDVFHDSRDLVQSSIDGYNVCLFAYGQTGSGKTYTIFGTPENPGLTPRGIKELFRLLHHNAEKLRFCVRCTMLELYQDSFRDLLLSKSPSPEGRAAKKLEIRKENNMVHVQGATTVEVQSLEECMAVYEEGQRHRRVASTRLNIASSRSHLIMSLVIETTDLQTQVHTRGKLSFVDLAGSERNKKSGSAGEQLKEAQAINKSLSALGDVISSLARGDPHIPYRNHRLTMLMSDSLGGNAKTLMFVNVSPTDANLNETQNSLQYATRVRTIKNEASKQSDEALTEMKKRLAFWKDMALDGHQEDVRRMIEPFL